VTNVIGHIKGERLSFQPAFSMLAVYEDDIRLLTTQFLHYLTRKVLQRILSSSSRVHEEFFLLTHNALLTFTAIYCVISTNIEHFTLQRSLQVMFIARISNKVQYKVTPPNFVIMKSTYFILQK
jgi:hypothetical protein